MDLDIRGSALDNTDVFPTEASFGGHLDTILPKYGLGGAGASLVSIRPFMQPGCGAFFAVNIQETCIPRGRGNHEQEGFEERMGNDGHCFLGGRGYDDGLRSQ
jgi:hypothetical protein